MKSKISVFIAILTIMGSGKSFGAFPVKQLSLNQNSLTGNNLAMISSSEKYKMATGVFRFSDFQTAGFKQYAMNNFISHISFVFGKTDFSQNLVTGFSRKSLESKGNAILTTGLIIMGIGLASTLVGGLMIGATRTNNDLGMVTGGGIILALGAVLLFTGLIVLICGFATNNSSWY